MFVAVAVTNETGSATIPVPVYSSFISRSKQEAFHSFRHDSLLVKVIPGIPGLVRDNTLKKMGEAR